MHFEERTRNLIITTASLETRVYSEMLWGPYWDGGFKNKHI